MSSNSSLKGVDLNNYTASLAKEKNSEKKNNSIVFEMEDRIKIISNTKFCPCYNISNGSNIKNRASETEWKNGFAKVAGTIFCVIGATVITLYKDPIL